MPNWLDDFERWVADVPSIPLYKKLAGVITMSVAIQRRRWLTLKRNRVYPSLYVIMVSRPVTGKSQAMRLCNGVLKYLRPGIAGVLPNSVTRASMLDSLTENLHIEGAGDIWHGAGLLVDELSVILHNYDADLISHLSELWNCDDAPWEESRRHSAKSTRLERPFLTMFAGVQPSVLGSILPEHAWTQGFCSRTIFAFTDDTVPFDPSVFEPTGQRPLIDEAAKKLAHRLEKMAEVHAQLDLAPEAREYLNEWGRAGWKPAPVHEKLADYNGRRWLQVLRISILRATGNGSRVVNVEDLAWSRQLLEDCEYGYYTMFLEMRRIADSDVYEDAYQYVVHRYASEKAPLSRAELYAFLVKRTSIHKVDAFIEGLVSSGFIEACGSLTLPTNEQIYRPKPRADAVPR